MSDAAGPGGDPGEEQDLLAAEYVLGVLDAAAAREVERRAEAEPALEAAIRAWEERLTPLALSVPPVPPPPALWERIAAGLPRPASSGLGRAWRSLPLWRGISVAALAAAAALAGLALLPPPAGPDYVAALGPRGTTAPFVAEAQPGGALVVRAVAPVTVAPGRDLELWALAPGATRPVPLGVLPPNGARLTAPPPAPGTQLLVSLEPRGGSPTGLPTGPVLYAGTLARAD